MLHINIAMLARVITLFFVTIIHPLSLIHSSIIPPPPPFNISHFLYPKVTALTDSSSPSQPRHFLQGVLEAISSKEKWALEDIRVSELGVKKAKYSSVRRYEFRVHVGTTEIVLKMYDEASEWTKLLALRKNGTSNFEALAREICSKAVIDSFKIEGPLELRVARDDDRFSLMLPLNTSLSGLRRISVGEGITVEVRGAEEISIHQPSDHHQLPYGLFTYTKWNEVGSNWPGLCTAPQPIRILGSASVVAYTNRRPTAIIQTAFFSRDAIELLPEKCYIRSRPNYKKPRHLLGSLSSRIVLLENVLRSFPSERGKSSAALGSLKARIRALTMFRFQLELERNIRTNDTYWSTLAEWRTRPTLERVQFEVVAKIKDEILMPVVIEKFTPFLDSDSFAWSSLSSNLSFTKFPPVLVPPEALTLDVKW